MAQPIFPDFYKSLALAFNILVLALA